MAEFRGEIGKRGESTVKNDQRSHPPMPPHKIWRCGRDALATRRGGRPTRRPTSNTPHGRRLVSTSRARTHRAGGQAGRRGGGARKTKPSAQRQRRKTRFPLPSLLVALELGPCPHFLPTLPIRMAAGVTSTNSESYPRREPRVSRRALAGAAAASSGGLEVLDRLLREVSRKCLGSV